jgi:hypothetical protein
MDCRQTYYQRERDRRPHRNEHAQLEALIIQKRYETDLNMYQIADILSQMGFNVSARLVADVLSDYGLSKKNR